MRLGCGTFNVLNGGSIMRLWKALHTSFRGKKGVRRADSRGQLAVEALDQRLLPSSVPNLSGLTMAFSPGNTLLIQSVQDQGGGKGTFVGVYADSRDGVSTPVSGTITLKGLRVDDWYDFGVAFSGTATSNHQFNPRTGIWSEDVSHVSGSGDFYTPYISDKSSAYLDLFAEWSYWGQESDSLTYANSGGSYVLGSYSGTVNA
jgi:hypothetical protein